MRGRDPDGFLENTNGVIHIGANEGQEREQYASLGLPVIWIEAIPDVFELLERNLAAFPNQRAIEALVTDRDGKRYDFHVANNLGASSSILELARHAEIWPEVFYTRDLALRSVTLATLTARERIDLGVYDALVLDTQGSELLILRGAGAELRKFRHVKLEVPDFEAYRDCCTTDEVGLFMRNQGFVEVGRTHFAESPLGGRYYDVVYFNRRAREART